MIIKKKKKKKMICQVCSDDDLRMTIDQGQICIPIHNVEKSFSKNVLKIYGCNLNCMVKVVKLISNNQNFIPLGYLPLPLGFVHVQNRINL